MSKFGEKKLDDSTAAGLLIEIGMFQSWTIENHKRDLLPEELDLVITGILEREEVAYTSDEAMALRFMTLANMDWDQMKEFRKKTGFDLQIKGFCKSINLPSSYCNQPWPFPLSGSRP